MAINFENSKSTNFKNISMMKNQTKSDTNYTELTVEQQQTIRGWGGTRPPRMRVPRVPKRPRRQL